MTSRIFLAPHHSTEELERRYKAADGGIERSHLQIIWLLSQGHAAKFVAGAIRRSARTCGAPMTTALWVWATGQSRCRPPARSAGGAARRGQCPMVWSGRKVALWIPGRIGRTVSPQRGVEDLRRLDVTRQVPANPKASLSEQARFKKSSRPASPSFKAPNARSKFGRYRLGL